MSKSIAIKHIVSINTNNAHDKYLEEISELSKFANTPYAQYVPQHYVGYISPTHANPTMVTTGLGPCIGLGIYNKITRHAALAHIDDVADEASVMNIFNKIRTNDSEPLKICVTGGNKLSYNYLSPLIQYLLRMENVEIALNDTFPANKGDLEVQTLAIDASGNFYTDIKDLLYKSIHPFKSPIFQDIIKANDGDYEFPLEEIDFSGDNYVPITEV